MGIDDLQNVELVVSWELRALTEVRFLVVNSASKPGWHLLSTASICQSVFPSVFGKLAQLFTFWTLFYLFLPRLCSTLDVMPQLSFKSWGPFNILHDVILLFAVHARWVGIFKNFECWGSYLVYYVGIIFHMPWSIHSFTWCQPAGCWLQCSVPAWDH